MNFLSKHFKTHENEVSLFRVWSFLVMIFIPFYGMILLETDIGLAICKRIVENHKGDFKIKSKEGEGSTFEFSIVKGLA